MPQVKAGDLDIHYIEKSEGTPVIFVHGNWGTCSWWEPTFERMPPGWHLLAYDMRGRGQTEGPNNHYTMPEMAADLRTFADALDIDTFHLVGHSLGTAVAMQFVLESAERVRSLTVMAPAWVDGMPDAYNAPAGQEAIKADPVLFARSLKYLAPAAPDDAYWQRLVTEGHEQRLEAALRNLPALTKWKPGDRLRETGVPALVIDGDGDILTGGANIQRAATALGARAVVLTDIGHSPNVEAPDK